MNGLKLATTFLTRLPLRSRQVDGPTLAGSVPWFPLVGLGVGAGVGASYSLLAPWLGGFTSAAISVGIGMLITGAFHEDGLADTFDGFGGGYEKDQVLQIMKDSRLGTFGAAALVAVLAVRIGVIGQLVAGPGAVAVVAAAGALSRAAAVSVMTISAPTSDSKLGTAYITDINRRRALFSVAATVVTAWVLLGLMAAVTAVASVAVIAVVVRRWSYSRIDGVGGDVLGAIQQLTEITALVTVVALAGVS